MPVAIKFIQKIVEAWLPSTENDGSNVYQIRSPRAISLEPGKSETICTGLELQLHDQFCAMLTPVQPLVERGIFSCNRVFEGGYEDFLQVTVRNTSDMPQYFPKGTPIADLTVLPIPIFTANLVPLGRESENKSY